MAAQLNRTGPVIGLLLGDPGGIGPEIAVRLLSTYADGGAQLLVLGSRTVLDRGTRHAGCTCLQLPVTADAGAVRRSGAPVMFMPMPELDHICPPTGRISPEAGAYSMAVLAKAVALARNDCLDGFTYAPMHKVSLQQGGSAYPDDIGLLSQLFGMEVPGSEMNILDELCTARVTSHIPLSEVPGHITSQGVLEAIQRLALLLETMDMSCRRLAVAGLNPHAGDNGLFGAEEAEVLAPAIAQAQAQGISVSGPYAPDTVFVRAQQGEFGGVVTMYHDQGQIAMKLLGFERGCTLASGLPIPVTTTGHGTAFDITGKGKAHPGSLIQALRICVAMAISQKEACHDA